MTSFTHNRGTNPVTIMLELLCVIFNRSLITGIFPDEWKCSKVIPLFKKVDRRLLDNYCPIWVIPVVAKIFERIIYNQVYTFLIENNILSNVSVRILHSAFHSDCTPWSDKVLGTQYWSWQCECRSIFRSKKSNRHRWPQYSAIKIKCIRYWGCCWHLV